MKLVFRDCGRTPFVKLDLEAASCVAELKTRLKDKSMDGNSSTAL